MLSLAGVAHAQHATQDDGKSYSPIYCTRTFNDASAAPYWVFPWGFLNNSAADMYVSCPIVKDEELSLTGLSYAAVNVTNPKGSTTRCSIYSLDAAANHILDWRGAETSLAGFQTLFLSPYPAKSDYYGMYGILCRLPPQGWLRSYTIYEKLGR